MMLKYLITLFLYKHIINHGYYQILRLSGNLGYYIKYIIRIAVHNIFFIV